MNVACLTTQFARQIASCIDHALRAADVTITMLPELKAFPMLWMATWLC